MHAKNKPQNNKLTKPNKNSSGKTNQNKTPPPPPTTKQNRKYNKVKQNLSLWTVWQTSCQLIRCQSLQEVAHQDTRMMYLAELAFPKEVGLNLTLDIFKAKLTVEAAAGSNRNCTRKKRESHVKLLLHRRYTFFKEDLVSGKWLLWSPIWRMFFRCSVAQQFQKEMETKDKTNKTCTRAHTTHTEGKKGQRCVLQAEEGIVMQAYQGQIYIFFISYMQRLPALSLFLAGHLEWAVLIGSGRFSVVKKTESSTHATSTKNVANRRSHKCMTGGSLSIALVLMAELRGKANVRNIAVCRPILWTLEVIVTLGLLCSRSMVHVPKESSVETCSQTYELL